MKEIAKVMVKYLEERCNSAEFINDVNTLLNGNITEMDGLFEAGDELLVTLINNLNTDIDREYISGCLDVMLYGESLSYNLTEDEEEFICGLSHNSLEDCEKFIDFVLNGGINNEDN